MKTVKSKILYIDTREQNRIFVGIITDSKKTTISKTQNTWTSQLLLPLIIELLKKTNLTFKDLDEIMIEKGPGSFTGLRVGMSVANTLGWLYGIKINGRLGQTEEPIYQK